MYVYHLNNNFIITYSTFRMLAEGLTNVHGSSCNKPLKLLENPYGKVLLFAATL